MGVHIFDVPDDKQRDQAYDYLMRLFEHAKEMQIHFANMRLKIIFGCGAFATALAGFLMKDYSTAAILLFNVMCTISIHMDKFFRCILYKWIITYTEIKSYSISLIKGEKIDISKIKEINNIPLKKKSSDFVTYALSAFRGFFVICSAIFIADPEQIEDFALDFYVLVFHVYDFLHKALLC